MKLKTHMLLLPIVMLMSAPVVATDNAEQGPAKPPAELRLLNSLNMSSSLSANRNTATAATAATAATPNVVDKVDVYIPQPDPAAPQK